MSKNCPNCGAPLGLGIKCEYCGTLYYDLTAIDFDSGEPIILTLKINGYEITQRCIPVCDGIDLEQDEVYCYDRLGNKLLSFKSGSASMTTNVKFLAVNGFDGHLAEIRPKKE